MHILICNDDGYSARGIKALTRVMKDFGRVTVVAPEYNHSGASSSLTLNLPLTVTQVEEDVYAASGTPADCVHLALTGLLEQKPDLVLSGINCGANMGDDTMYSGTVAAAVEGYIFGIDAIAFSQIEKGWGHLEDAARMAASIVERFLRNKRKEEAAALLNVNMPNIAWSEFQGTTATRLGRRHPAHDLVRETNPRGMPVYWLGAAGSPRDDGQGTDFWAVRHGYVSVTPLQIDLTAHERIKNAAKWMAS